MGGGADCAALACGGGAETITGGVIGTLCAAGYGPAFGGFIDGIIDGAAGESFRAAVAFACSPFLDALAAPTVPPCGCVTGSSRMIGVAGTCGA